MTPVVSAPAERIDLLQAYVHCRKVAKREAKNFYYAFLALPWVKSNAMCAMYAFMRRADDLSDDEAIPVEQRRRLMAQWSGQFQRGAVEGELAQEHGAKQDRSEADADLAVFAAVRDTQRRFGIDDALLEDLVAGTAMDLAEALPEGVTRMTLDGQPFDCYETVEALDRYCYLVASVVGLVTVRIFGVDGAAADDDAVRMGKAFQYTNILRDVREDAERGRVYLPLELLQAHGARVEDVVAAARGHAVAPGLQTAMAAMGARAEEYYGAGRRLLPLLARDSRPAMKVLIRIYYALLVKIRRRGYAVFGKRIQLSTARKLFILLRGLVASAAGRIG